MTKIRGALFRRTRAENFRDVRVAHESERLAFRLEARDDFVGFRLDLDQPDRNDFDARGAAKLGAIDGAGLALPQELAQPIGADLRLGVGVFGADARPHDPLDHVAKLFRYLFESRIV